VDRPLRPERAGHLQVLVNAVTVEVDFQVTGKATNQAVELENPGTMARPILKPVHTRVCDTQLRVPSIVSGRQAVHALRQNRKMTPVLHRRLFL
jgi:hypothetical protein